MKRILNLLLLLLLALGTGCRHSAPRPVAAVDRFTDSVLLPAAGVKDQGKSGACWAFGGISLLESDCLRDPAAAKEINLSEAWLVRHAYYEKAVKYVRTRGFCDFSQGGELHDALLLTRRWGAVPETVYPGDFAGEKCNHAALNRAVHRLARRIVDRELYRTPGWEARIGCLLDELLGPCPERFCVNGTEYTAVGYADSLGLRSADYIGFTSFSHHPFYDSFALEFADNWLGEPSVNLPPDELMEVLDEALRKGYTVGWCGDTADRGFRWRQGIAGLKKGDVTTSQSRREAFDRQQLRDRHVLHIIGIARHESGRIFYKAKNSWGENAFGGYIYLSENYLRKNTVELVVNCEAVSEQLLEKCGLSPADCRSRP